MKPELVGREGGFQPVGAEEIYTGFLADSIIMTMKGEMRVADLKEGDRVITRDQGMSVLRAVHKRTVTAPCIQIRAGSLGHTRPERDTLLPAGQPILIRDWRARAVFGAPTAMVPAECLVDGEFITLRADETYTVYELEFDTDHVIYVDGLEVASRAPEVEYRTAA